MTLDHSTTGPSVTRLFGADCLLSIQPLQQDDIEISDELHSALLSALCSAWTRACREASVAATRKTFLGSTDKIISQDQAFCPPGTCLCEGCCGEIIPTEYMPIALLVMRGMGSSATYAGCLASSPTEMSPLTQKYVYAHIDKSFS